MRTAIATVILSSVPFVSFAADKVRILHTVGPMSYHSWIYFGKEKGIFEKQGIDLEILGSGGSAAKTDLALALGNAEASFSDFSSVVITNDKVGAPKIKMALPVDYVGSDVLITRKPIKDLSELNGMKLGANPNSTSAKLMSIVAPDVKPDFINIPVKLKEVALMKGEIDGYTGYVATNIPRLVVGLKLEENKDFFVTPLVSRNSWTVGRGVILNTQWATENEDVAKRFIEASIVSILNCWDETPTCLQSLEKVLGAKYEAEVETYRMKHWYDDIVLRTRVFPSGQFYRDRSDDLKIYSDKIANAMNLKLLSIEDYYVNYYSSIGVFEKK